MCCCVEACANFTKRKQLFNLNSSRLNMSRFRAVSEAKSLWLQTSVYSNSE